MAALRAEELATTFIRTDECAVDFLSCSSQVLLALILAVIRRLLLVRRLRNLGSNCLHRCRDLGILLLVSLPLLFLYNLGASLSLAGLLQKLLLMLLLAKAMQEFVRLGQDLRHQSVFIEVLDVEYLASALVVGRTNLIDVGDKVLIL